MNRNTDPAMQPVTEWINRSAVQHKRRISEGSESAARIAKRLESECGFGACSGHPDCRDRQCPEHPCKTGMLGLPVIDPDYLDEQLYRKDAGGFGGLDHLPVEMIEPIRSVKVWAEHLKTAALVVAAGLALACTFYVSTP